MASIDLVNRVPLELLELEPMASGLTSLRLTRRISWSAFPRYVEAVAALLGGTIVHRADSPAERVWEITIEGRPFWIAFDDHGLGVSLDPQSSEASALVPDLRERLVRHRDSAVPGVSELLRLRMYLSHRDSRAPEVSAWSVGMHIEHCCLAMSRVCGALLGSEPPPPRDRFSLLR